MIHLNRNFYLDKIHNIDEISIKSDENNLDISFNSTNLNTASSRSISKDSKDDGTERVEINDIQNVNNPAQLKKQSSTRSHQPDSKELYTLLCQKLAQPRFLIQLSESQDIQELKSTKDYQDWIKKLHRNHNKYGFLLVELANNDSSWPMEIIGLKRQEEYNRSKTNSNNTGHDISRSTSRVARLGSIEKDEINKNKFQNMKIYFQLVFCKSCIKIILLSQNFLNHSF